MEFENEEELRKAIKFEEKEIKRLKGELRKEESKTSKNSKKIDEYKEKIQKEEDIFKSQKGLLRDMVAERKKNRQGNAQASKEKNQESQEKSEPVEIPQEEKSEPIENSEPLINENIDTVKKEEEPFQNQTKNIEIVTSSNEKKEQKVTQKESQEMENEDEKKVYTIDQLKNGVKDLTAEEAKIQKLLETERDKKTIDEMNADLGKIHTELKQKETEITDREQAKIEHEALKKARQDVYMKNKSKRDKLEAEIRELRLEGKKIKTLSTTERDKKILDEMANDRTRLYELLSNKYDEFKKFDDLCKEYEIAYPEEVQENSAASIEENENSNKENNKKSQYTEIVDTDSINKKVPVEDRELEEVSQKVITQSQPRDLHPQPKESRLQKIGNFFSNIWKKIVDSRFGQFIKKLWNKITKNKYAQSAAKLASEISYEDNNDYEYAEKNVEHTVDQVEAKLDGVDIEEYEFDETNVEKENKSSKEENTAKRGLDPKNIEIPDWLRKSTSKNSNETDIEEYDLVEIEDGDKPSLRERFSHRLEDMKAKRIQKEEQEKLGNEVSDIVDSEKEEKSANGACQFGGYEFTDFNSRALIKKYQEGKLTKRVLLIANTNEMIYLDPQEGLVVDDTRSRTPIDDTENKKSKAIQSSRDDDEER